MFWHWIEWQLEAAGMTLDQLRTAWVVPDHLHANVLGMGALRFLEKEIWRSAHVPTEFLGR
jgi:hypothetical protein